MSGLLPLFRRWREWREHTATLDAELARGCELP